MHDSFIVRECHEDRLKEVMRDSYQQVMGQPISVTQDPFWLEPSPEQRKLDELGVRSLDEGISELEYHPHYAGYLKRKFAVQSHLGHDWLRTHQWFSG